MFGAGSAINNLVHPKLDASYVQKLGYGRQDDAPLLGGDYVLLKSGASPWG
jgi:hypothetical protein